MDHPQRSAALSPRATAALPDRVLYGVAYYHEYQPRPRLDADLDLMAAAGLSVIRVGESVWSTWEPADGVFDLDWLAPVLDGAHDRGIAVVLGTPTYAIPPWLHRRYPEVMAERSSGAPIPYGHRQDVDHSHPAFRHLAERVVRAVVTRYADHPAVIGYQVDNEPGAELLHNAGAFAGFVARLREEFNSVDELNRRWGLTYWSHRLSDWSDLWRPDGNTTQGYDLAWRRYQAALTTEFIDWQARLVRSLARPDQFVTTCIAYGRPGMHGADLAATLDVAAVNPYYAMQDAFARPRPAGAAQGRPPAWSRGTGVWWLAFEADTVRGAAGPFLVTETNAGSIGDAWSNFPSYDGQWRQAAWTFVARGARMVEYWHWHTLHHGAETYWGGVLGHSLTPGRTYAEVARIGAELAAAGPAVVDLVPDVDVAFLRDEDSRWAMQFQPPVPVAGTDAPDTDAYDTLFGAFYRGFHDAGLQAAVVSTRDLGSGSTGAADGAGAAELAARHPVLVVPFLYVATDEVLEELAGYVAAGGHLVVTFRTGYVDGDGTARPEVMPGRLRQAAGVSYTEYSNLSVPLPVLPGDERAFVVPRGATASAWADGLVTEGATVLVRYDHPHFGRWPAVTTAAHGAGRLTYVATLPDPALMTALARWLVPRPANAAWGELPPSVTVTGARSGEAHLSFVSNWSHDRVRVVVPPGGVDLLTGAALPGGAGADAATDGEDRAGELVLGPWDVRVVVDGAGPALPA